MTGRHGSLAIVLRHDSFAGRSVSPMHEGRMRVENTWIGERGGEIQPGSDGTRQVSGGQYRRCDRC